jgi:orotidine-5'-phosphate decarboxylase
MPSFGERLSAVFQNAGHLCVGIDPHPFLLAEWGLADTAVGLQEFGLRVVDAAVGSVGIVKPQVAFFERHGSGGYTALETTMAAARAAGLLVIADVKRGDVGSSVEAYAQSWLIPGAPLEADAITVSAYQGVGTLESPINLARISGKGLFVLAATSNPEGWQLQSAIVGDGPHQGRSVAASIVEDVRELNMATDGIGSVGLVLGATIDLERCGIDRAALSGTPILAPGFGEQGAQFSALRRHYGPGSDTAVVSVSRAILRAGPAGLAFAIRDQAAELATALAA